MLPHTMLTWIGHSGAAPVPGHRPWPRWQLDGAGWQALIERVSVSAWSLVGLWAEPGVVHMSLRDDQYGDIGVFSHACVEGRYLAVSPVRPAAQRLERAIHDLYGLTADGLADRRPWLDHGAWGIRRPLAGRPESVQPGGPYLFLPAEGESLHQIPVGPVHAGIIEPGHFRFTANGEAVVRLEERLGYVHKGAEGLMRGKTPAEAARVAARISGDSTVAYSLAFAQAVEAALDAAPPPRAVWLRALMAETERIANHLGDIGSICNDASVAALLALCHGLREKVARCAAQCFGHRLMMDRIVPGGVAVDLSHEGAEALKALIVGLRVAFEEVVEVYDATNSLLDRTVGTGVVGRNLVHRFGAGGFVGRASNRDFDARRSPGYPPYDRLEFDVPVQTSGDVNARLWVRVAEVTASSGLIETILERLPQGPIAGNLPATAGEGMALVESFRGEMLMWVRLAEDGTVARCHPRDASWFQWPLLEAAIEGNIVADFPLCNKSFNCSYSGHDL